MRIEWFFIWTNLNSLHPKMLCAKFGWNWPSGFGEDDFWISSMYCCYFVVISHHLNKLKFSSPKDVWLTLAQWFWRRRWKYGKFTDRRMTDDRRSEKLTWVWNSNKRLRVVLWGVFRFRATGPISTISWYNNCYSQQLLSERCGPWIFCFIPEELCSWILFS